MTLRRYERAPVIGLNFRYGTSYAIPAIRQNIANNNIKYKEIFLMQGERLDIIAGKEYGDGSLWWIIAAASNIGWGLQAPPGTRILIPSLEDVGRLIG